MEQQRPRSITQDDLHAGYVDRSIRELQRMVQANEDELAKLRSSDTAKPATPAASLEIMKTAYQEAIQTDLFLPFPDSVLPALVALRKTHQVVVESQRYVASHEPSLAQAQKQLALEMARLDDQKALQRALEARVSALRSGLETRRDMTPRQHVKEKMDGLRSKKRDYDKDTSALLKALREFIQGQLGPMLAAEELGGPIVGGMVDVQTDVLAAGFSSQGKPKRRADGKGTGKTTGSSRIRADKRQRRIDDIWGPRTQRSDEEGEGRQGSGNNEEENENDEWDEATAAGAEMQELTEQLLNALVEANGDSSSAYVLIPRESAAARFLVRSKVALFHPRDAQKLRLVDFGRELDD